MSMLGETTASNEAFVLQALAPFVDFTCKTLLRCLGSIGFRTRFRRIISGGWQKILRPRIRSRLETMSKRMRIRPGIRTQERLMKLVLEHNDWQRQKCGSLENLHVHHRIKRSQQGDDALGNLVTLCAYCHMAEHGHLGFAGKATQTRNENLARGRRLHRASL